MFTAQKPGIDLAHLTIAFGSYSSSLADLFDPTKYAAHCSLSVVPSLGIELGVIEIAFAAVGKVTTSFELGLNAGSLAAWSYAGNAKGFGQKMLGTSNGWGNVSSGTEVNAIIIATESFDSWGQFSAGFNTGTTSSARVTSDVANLTFLGNLSAGSLNTGVAQLSKQLNLFMFELNGAKASVDIRLQASVGIDIPTPDVMLPGLAIDVAAVLEALLGLDIDIGVEIGAITLDIKGILKLAFDLGLQLSAGGLTVWLYSGAASGLGPALASATANGLPGANGPNAPVYGVVVATELPSVWANFSTIFGVAA